MTPETKGALSEQFRITVLEILGDVLEHEPKALHDLIEYRVSVGDAFMHAETPVVVQVDDVKAGTNPQLGLLGIINGFLGNDHRIIGIFEKDGTLSGFAPFKAK